MRLGITLGGGFSPGPSKSFFNNSSLVAMIFPHSPKIWQFGVSDNRQYKFSEIGPRQCSLKWINNDLGLIS